MTTCHVFAVVVSDCIRGEASAAPSRRPHSKSSQVHAACGGRAGRGREREREREKQKPG